MLCTSAKLCHGRVKDLHQAADALQYARWSDNADLDGLVERLGISKKTREILVVFLVVKVEHQ